MLQLIKDHDSSLYLMFKDEPAASFMCSTAPADINSGPVQQTQSHLMCDYIVYSFLKNNDSQRKNT